MNLDNFLLDLKSLKEDQAHSTSSRSKALVDGGSPLRLVHLDGRFREQIGMVLAVPNITNLLRPGFDPTHPLASKMSPEGFEKIIFARGATVADLTAEAQVVAQSQTIMGRAKDNVNSEGCALLTDNVPVLNMVKNTDGSIETLRYSADGEDTFLAIPIGGTTNMTLGFSGSRYTFDELWIVPSKAAAALLKANPNGLNTLLGTQLTAVDDVRKKLATVIPPHSSPMDPVRLHICNTAKVQKCP
jgi:hypothetical protein